MYERLVRPLLFKLSPEAAHLLTLRLLAFVGSIPPLRNLVRVFFASTASHQVNLFGLNFPNPVGLAAGYDKDARAVWGLSTLGFGHIEIGTITPEPQKGNPKPRVFRLVKDRAVINRLGFPGKGADFCSKKLAKSIPTNTILGINIGKNKDTPLSKADQDYSILVEKLSIYADYFAINISSPNTEGLRKLQHTIYLKELLDKIVHTRDIQSSHLRKKIPLLVKLSPDMSINELDQALDVILSSNMDGIIATNTTISRENLSSTLAIETGGLSGKPLTRLSTQVIAHIHKQTGGKIPIIGVGGILSLQDAQEKIDAGAKLVQIYTGLIYHGPRLVQTIIDGLVPSASAENL